DGQALRSRAGGEAQLRQSRPSGVDERPEPRLGIRCRIPGAHPETVSQEVRHPAAADHPSSDAGDRAHLVTSDTLGHARGRRERISRASSGVATSAPIASIIVTALATSSALLTLLPL